MNINTTDIIQFNNSEIYDTGNGIEIAGKEFITNKIKVNTSTSINTSFIKNNGDRYTIKSYNQISISPNQTITSITNSDVSNNIEYNYTRIKLSTDTLLSAIYSNPNISFGVMIKRIGSSDKTYHTIISNELSKIYKNESNEYYIDIYVPGGLEITDTFSLVLIINDTSTQNSLEREIVFKEDRTENSNNVVTIIKDTRKYKKYIFNGTTIILYDDLDNILSVASSETKESISNSLTTLNTTATYTPILTLIGNIDIDIVVNEYFGLTRDISTIGNLRTLIGKTASDNIYPGLYPITQTNETVALWSPLLYKYSFTQRTTETTIPFANLLPTSTGALSDISTVFNGTTSAQLVNSGLYNQTTAVNKLLPATGTVNTVKINESTIKKVTSTNTYPILIPTNKIFVTRINKVDITDLRLFIKVNSTILSTENANTVLAQERVESVVGSTPGTNIKLKTYPNASICKLTYEVYQLYEPKNVTFKVNTILQKIGTNIIDYKANVYASPNISDILKTIARQDSDITFTTLSMQLRNTFTNSSLTNGTSATLSLTIPANTLRYSNNFLYKKMEILGTHKFNNFYFQDHAEFPSNLNCPGISLPINPEKLISEIYARDFENVNFG